MPQVNVVFFAEPYEVSEAEAAELRDAGLLRDQREPAAGTESPPANPNAGKPSADTTKENGK